MWHGPCSVSTDDDDEDNNEQVDISIRNQDEVDDLLEDCS